MTVSNIETRHIPTRKNGSIYLAESSGIARLSRPSSIFEWCCGGQFSLDVV